MTLTIDDLKEIEKIIDKSAERTGKRLILLSRKKLKRRQPALKIG